jgi:hypothetical protein
MATGAVGVVFCRVSDFARAGSLRRLPAAWPVEWRQAPPKRTTLGPVWGRRPAASMGIVIAARQRGYRRAQFQFPAALEIR